MSIFKLLIASAVTAVTMLLSASSVLAVDAAATVQLNVRSGPSTSYGVVDSLDAGEVVQVGECSANGWCYIYHSGPNGWVSSNFLSTTPGGSTDPDCSLSLTFNSSGPPSLVLTCGSGSVAVPAPIPTPVGNKVCFYTHNNYSGAEFCRGVGKTNVLNATFNNRISSIKLYGAAKAKICKNVNVTGACRLVAVDIPALGGAFNDHTSSLAVFTGAAPAPAPAVPVTFSTGLIKLKQTFSANLDNGNIGGPGADIWYEAVTAANKFITPRNGAKLALGNGSNRGYAGCRAASFSGARISIWAIPVGTYVCAKTAQGRISQFRLNGYIGTTMRLGYTTWAN